LQARISKCEAFAGLANCGWSVAWEPLGDLATRNPPTLRVEGRRRRSVYNPLYAVLPYFIIHV